MDINHCISELLSVHDCVIIPGFGGFIGNYSPAQIDPVNHSFRPPSKKLLFNINLRQNDGLLASCYASLNGTSYDEACLAIDEFIQQCKSILRSGKPFILPEVGRLFPGREGNIQFEQDKNSNLLPDAFGLMPFIAPPMDRGRRTAKLIQPVTEGAGQPALKKRLLPRTLRWAAALAIPIGLATMIGISQFDKPREPGENDAGIFSSVFSRFSSASLVEKKDAPARNAENNAQYAPTPSVFEQFPEPEEILPQTTETASPASEKTTISSPPANEPQVADRSGTVYAVIIGAFRSKENAGTLIRECKEKGMVASVFDRSSSGLYRVALGTFSQREEALQLLSSAKSGDFSGAWLLSN